MCNSNVARNTPTQNEQVVGTINPDHIQERWQTVNNRKMHNAQDGNGNVWEPPPAHDRNGIHQMPTRNRSQEAQFRKINHQAHTWDRPPPTQGYTNTKAQQLGTQNVWAPQNQNDTNVYNKPNVRLNVAKLPPPYSIEESYNMYNVLNTDISPNPAYNMA